MNILVTICARGGSKRVPDKNIKEIQGKPLVNHTIGHAFDWGKATDVVVSTDDHRIADISRNAGAQVPFTRPDSLANDEAAKLPVIKHATRQSEEVYDTHYDVVIDLDPTSPLRSVEDIDRCLKNIQAPNVNNVYTVCEADKNPYFNMVELDENGYAHLSKEPSGDVDRGQDAPVVYEMNASIYAFKRSFLRETDSIHSDQTKVVVMPPERSVDIDRPIDLKLVELLMEEQS